MKKIKYISKKNKLFKLFVSFTLIIFFALYIILKIENNFSKKMIVFCEAEVNKLSKNIMLDVVNDAISSNDLSDELLKIDKNSLGKIQSIELNTSNVNKLISLINNNIKNYFKDLEQGKTNSINLDNNLLTNSLLKSRKEGIIFEIPIGVVLKSTFLSNVGPKIPVKLVITGDLESKIKTEIVDYGINNALLKVFINIKISEQILLPLSTKIINVETEIPLITKMIQGEIPSYYFENS